jgi:predicted phosphodiesterase
MRVAALYDIHGNLPALEAVLDDVRQAGARRVIVGGDVLPGPMPCETIALLRDLELPVQFIHGNGDREVVGWRRGNESDVIPESYRETMRWVARQLHPDEETLLAGWPDTVQVQVDGLGEVLFCHATPRNDTEIFTRQTDEERLRPIFDGLNVPVVVCGHTHMQFDRMVGKTRVVNAGSVGMPFAEPGAYWLLLGPDIQLRRTPYNLASAADRIRATAYPQAEAFATRNVLQPPTERDMLDVFAQGELT